ncbi:hypothetical protein [Streptomyces candidus]|uniref:Uncharacterized protein n=1 Tax=Streptomyces candidus TaxID=67283 RepID=A0A7X0HLG6_9ACTN|nr:hypothetical protein [Streptomyces candidus]MBB6439877.1 hypothetical protein [Streptomyces candidus]GHH55819.1 hypothetical protein GCM10018773_60760 [Streptomyces candidus]
MARLGVAYSAVQDSVGAAAIDEVYLDAPGWSAVVTAAAGWLRYWWPTTTLR